MGKSKRKIDKKRPIKELTKMCEKHYGVEFEHWNWSIEEMFTDKGFLTTLYGVAVELPNKTLGGVKTPNAIFIRKSSGSTKGLIECCNAALAYMYANLEGITYDYSNPWDPQYIY